MSAYATYAGLVTTRAHIKSKSSHSVTACASHVYVKNVYDVVAVIVCTCGMRFAALADAEYVYPRLVQKEPTIRLHDNESTRARGQGGSRNATA